MRSHSHKTFARCRITVICGLQGLQRHNENQQARTRQNSHTPRDTASFYQGASLRA
jgi:hypothetical protein